MPHHRIDRVPFNWLDFLSPGHRVTAISHGGESYYHTDVSLIFDDGKVVTATADEHNLAHLFDCFTLALAEPSVIPENHAALLPAFDIKEGFALIRDEWLLPTGELDGETIGNNPHMQFSGPPGSAPEDAVASATLLAGMLLIARDGRQMAVITSDEIPLNVDIVTDGDEVEAAVGRHACQSLNIGKGIS